MWEFKEELKNPCITGKVPNQFKNEDGDYDCVKAIIDWTLDFEVRGYGVKDTYIHIIKVTLIFDDWDYGLEKYNKSKMNPLKSKIGYEILNSSWPSISMVRSKK